MASSTETGLPPSWEILSSFPWWCAKLFSVKNLQT